MVRELACMRDTTMCKINFAGLKGGTLGRKSRQGGNGARVYLYTGAFQLGGPPVCWENGSRIYLYARYPPFAIWGAESRRGGTLGR